jgi:hypothetical protein
MAIPQDFKDEIPNLILTGATLLSTMRNRGGHGTIIERGAQQGPSFLASLLTAAMTVWKEKGGSMADESELLEALFGHPERPHKTAKLTGTEHKKVGAVMKAMSVAERKVFRIALFLLDPEVSTIDVPEVKGPDGKVVTPATKKTERTGVDPRVDVLRGIASHVEDDLSNAEAVAVMLRDTGALGGNNEALTWVSKMSDTIKHILTKVADVDSIEEVTLEKLKSRLTSLIGERPDPALPRPNDNAGFLLRMGRSMTPGAFPRSTPPIEVRRTQKRKRVSILVIVILTTVVLTLAYLTTHSHTSRGTRNVLPSQTPTVWS